MHGRLIREIVVAVRSGGGDVSANARLRLALSRARSANLGKDVITRAISRAEGASSAQDNYQDVLYEAFGPSGVAFVIEAQTDNRHRTASDIRAIFHKGGGHLADGGSVIHGFEHEGVIVFPSQSIDGERLMEDAIDKGALDIEEEAHRYIVRVAKEAFHTIYGQLEATYGEAEHACLVWRPLSFVPVSSTDLAMKIQLLEEQLEDNEDISAFFANHRFDGES